ncbi:MAG: hypothetical protein H0W64_06845 [Gammaproteobacteria bacterium]|nr:hypothetical protein [Gammaproteobacteria bacterium]
MIIPFEKSYKTLDWQSLYQAAYGTLKRFNLALSADEDFTAKTVLRHVPQRRVVVSGIWRGKKVVAKIFISPKHSKKHMEREFNGNRLLVQNKIPTPSLLFYGATCDKRIHILIFQCLQHVRSLHALWMDHEHGETAKPQLKAVVIELATQHVLGIIQKDLHLKNFLVGRKIVYTLDGAQITHHALKINKKTSINHLALFLSQLGVGCEGLQKKLFESYAKARGWLLKPADTIELFRLIKQWHEKRWQHFAEKIFRTSNDFVKRHTWSMLCMSDRAFISPEFNFYLENPEAFFHHPTCQVLKQGRSATVIKINLNGKALVVKRYNLKNLWHRIRRMTRATRAAVSWRLAHKLQLFGIKTAKPIAFIEKRFLGLRGTSYYISEYIQGETAAQYFERHEETITSPMVDRLADLLRNLAKLTITHGDLKITNIIIDEHLAPVLIDLDGTQEHLSLSSLRTAWRYEIKRFLNNFNHQQALYEQFKLKLEN